MSGEGLHCYLGTTGTGKTTAALADARALASERGIGLLVLDVVSTPTLATAVPNSTQSFEEALALAYGPGEVRLHGDALGDPETQDALLRALRAGGDVVVVLDEVGFWTKAKELRRILRAWRASNLHVYMTGHHVGTDFAQAILACNPRLHLFRITAPLSIEFARRYLGVDRDVIRSLGLGERITVSL